MAAGSLHLFLYELLRLLAGRLAGHRQTDFYISVVQNQGVSYSLRVQAKGCTQNLNDFFL